MSKLPSDAFIEAAVYSRLVNASRKEIEEAFDLIRYGYTAEQFEEIMQVALYFQKLHHKTYALMEEDFKRQQSQ